MAFVTAVNLLPQPIKILVADDDPTALEEMRDMVEFEGWDCITVTSIDAAMDKMDADETISVVVTDVHFDGGTGETANGIQFLSRARARYPKRKVAYVVLSGDPMAERASDQVGAFTFLKKPLVLEDFVNAVYGAALTEGKEPDVAERFLRISRETAQ